MSWVEVNGIVLRRRLTGDPRALPGVVLIHEIGGTLESWDAVTGLLAPTHAVLAHDQRGAGLSEKVRGPLRIEDLVADIAALMDGAGMETATLAGGAIGGAVALAFAAAHPERTHSVLALAPATGIPSERRAATLANADTVEREGQRPGIAAKLDRSWPKAIRTPAFARTRLQRLAGDPASTAAMLRMLADLDIGPILAAQKRPVTILAGTHDRDRPPETVRALAERLPGADFRKVDSGHFIHIHDPDFVAAEIARLAAT